ncbi:MULTISPECIES: SRPBCC family protein [Pseudovibrio]|uniref:SRPBCC family protein n=1 Tax=Stappiaceae TaxID=2821832 RepID=UPI002366DADF|nr:MULTISPECIES: carbon monoxide dehydrogenase subunit G [Pseudovibrio]MDD7910040.1 carbon monoxide dehydrogenase subunit G [Pseudovibrio exalbescens]MDX5592323.1 carbon monoxide dehydrogenase subunit G [Pseudovibrio sp. SPO723]
MEMTGEQHIPASREKVWEALNDPEVLKQCIPGCETLEKKSETELSAVVMAKVGPVKAKFNGEVKLQDLDPPNSYKIVGEGKGGVAGFAKGGAHVTLSEAEGGTLLSYNVDAKVGGKLAQLGSRLVDSTAKKMAEEFFSKFTEIVAGPATPTTGPAVQDVELDAGVMEEAKTIATEHVVEEAVHEVEEVVKNVEEKVEVAAAKNVLGGPMMWGFGALLILIALYLMF